MCSLPEPVALAENIAVSDSCVLVYTRNNRLPADPGVFSFEIKEAQTGNVVGTLTAGPNPPTASTTFSHCIVANSGGSIAWNPAAGTDLGNNFDADPRFLIPIEPIELNADSLPDAYEAQGDELDTDDDGLSDTFERLHTYPTSPTALDPLDDLDFDGLSALLEFAFGLDPLVADHLPPVTLARLAEGGSAYLSIIFRRALWAERHLEITVERSTDLGSLDAWSSGETTVIDRTPLDQWTSELTERSNLPVEAQPAEHLRVWVRKK